MTVPGAALGRKDGCVPHVLTQPGEIGGPEQRPGTASQVPGVHQGRYLLVNSPTVAHRVDPEAPGVMVDGVDDTEAPDAVLPEPLQLPLEGLPHGGIATESLEGILYRSL